MVKRCWMFVAAILVVTLTPLYSQPTKVTKWSTGSRAAASDQGIEPRREVVLTGPNCTITKCNAANHCDTDVGPSLCLQQTCNEVSWRACAQDRGVRGLWVGQVDLKRAPGEPWVDVLWEAGLADLITPYHNGKHLPDMRGCTAEDGGHYCLRSLGPSAVGPSGIVLPLSGQAEPRLAVELRDRGVAWLCTWQDAQDLKDRSLVRRGEEMVLWGVYDTGNYDFIIEYAFGDDGAIRFRLGATGYNAPDFSAEAHMHTALWRLDLDVNGYQGDTARWLVHREGFPTPLEAKDLEPLFGGGKEGGSAWVAPFFTTLLVEDTATNAHGNPLAYEVVPSKRGRVRHNGATEKFTQHEFWVTVWKDHEAGYTEPIAWHRTGQVLSDTFLVEAASQGGKEGPESIVNKDIVVWYKAGEHHDPHDEDRSALDRGSDPEGVTLVHWLGFDLVPHNFFNHNPLSGPHRTECGEAP